MIKKIIISFLFILNYAISFSQEYPLTKQGIPTSKGIEYYIKQNEVRFISEYQKLVNDSLYDVYVSIDDLSKYVDNDNLDALGYCFSEKGSSEIILTNEEKYIAYESSMLSKYKRRNINEANNFVKGVFFHELTHFYFNQVIIQMRLDSMYVCPDYNNFSMIPHLNVFSSKFIEEGICMYVTIKIGECLLGKDYMPETLEEIKDKQNKYDILYKYSAEYVKTFIDQHGIKKSIQMLVSTKPPTYEELLNPDKYWCKFK